MTLRPLAQASGNFKMSTEPSTAHFRVIVSFAIRLTTYDTITTGGRLLTGLFENFHLWKTSLKASVRSCMCPTVKTLVKRAKHLFYQ
jgi:hypothetical protein